MILALLMGMLSAFAAEAPAVAAAPADSCRAVKFPFSRKQTAEELGQLFAKVDRAALEAYYFHELTSAQAVKPDKVSRGLGTFLAQTELDRDRRMFYRLLGETAGWKSGEKKPLELSEICSAKKKLAQPPRD